MNKSIFVLSGRIVSLIKTLFSYCVSFECVFVLFLFAGVYKSIEIFAWFPLDITAFFFAVSVIWGIFVAIKKKLSFSRESIIFAFAGLIFVLYAAMSLCWTSSSIYAQEKALYISTLVFWALLGTSLIISQEYARVRKFFILLCVFSIWVAVESIIFYVSNGPSSFITAMGFGGSYVNLGRTIGLGVIIVLNYSLFSSRSNHIKLLQLLISVFLLFILLILGGRGPLLATVLPCIILGVFEADKILKPKYIILFLIIIGLLSGFVYYLYSTGNVVKTLVRFQALLEPGFGGSVGTRMIYYSYVFSSWIENPIFGHGIGSWSTLLGVGDFRIYPHDIILEILFELGLVGLISFFFMIYYALNVFIKRASRGPLLFKSIVMMMFANAFINALVSGDIPSNRVLFAMTGLLIFGNAVRGRGHNNA